MMNNDLYKELEKKFGRNRMIIFADVVSEMYGLLYIDAMMNEKDHPLTEFDFERDYWIQKYTELIENNQSG